MLSRRDLAVDLLQDGPARLVREADAVEPHRPAEGRCGHRARQVPHVGRAVQDIEHALPRGGCLREAPGVLGEVPHRVEGVPEVGEEHDQVARGHCTAQHEPRAEPQRQRRGDGNEQVHRALQPGRQARGVGARRQVLAALAGEDAGERPFQREGVNHLDRSDRLGRGGSHRTLLLALPAGRIADAPAEPRRAHPEQRSGRQGEERERGVEPEHHGGDAHECERVREQRQERRHGDVLQEADVADHAHDQVAALRSRVKREREPLEVAVQLATHGREHAVADQGEAHGVVVGGERPQSGEADHRERREHEERGGIDVAEQVEPGAGVAVGGGGGEDAIQHHLQGPGLEQPEADLGVERDERGSDQPALAPHVRPEAPQQPSQAGQGVAQARRLRHL